MTLQRSGSPTRTGHSLHDPLTIAAAAAGDVTGVDAAAVARLLDTCTDCASLHADLAAISRATRSLSGSTTRAARDFRLSPAQAERLRGGWWRRIARRAARSLLDAQGVGRPLATAFTTLGLIGLLLGSPLADLRLGAMTGAAPDRELVTEAEPSAEPAPNATDNAFVPSSSGDREGQHAGGSTGGSEAGGPKASGAIVDVTTSHDGGTASRPAPTPLGIASIALLVAGLGLFALRRFGSRLA